MMPTAALLWGIHTAAINTSMFSPTTYSNIEDKVSDNWEEETALDEMAKVAGSEMQLANESEDIIEHGTPFITVVGDRVWAK